MGSVAKAILLCTKFSIQRKLVLNMDSMGKFLAVLLVMSGLVMELKPWCTTAGGVGEYSTKCPSSVDFEACFAMCQCYDANDNPTHTMNAICVLMNASVSLMPAHTEDCHLLPF